MTRHLGLTEPCDCILRSLRVLRQAGALRRGFGWLAYEIKMVREQREAVTAIEKLGGSVSLKPASGGMIRTAMAQLVHRSKP